MSAINSTNPYNNFLQIRNLQSKSVHNSLNSGNSLLPVNEPIAAINLTPEEEEKSNNFTKAVAGVAIFGGILGIILGKANSGAFYKKLNIYLQKLNNKIYDYSQKYSTLSNIQKFGLKVTKGVQKALGWINMGNNITAFKDVGFKRVGEKLHLTKPMSWITKWFQSITVRSSAKAYEKARNVMDIKIQGLRDYLPKIKNDADRVELQALIGSIEKNMHNLTSATERNLRLKNTISATENVGNKVLTECTEIMKNKSKRNIDKLRLYRTEVHSAEGKESLTHILETLSRAFTFNVSDKTKIMSNARDEISRIIKVEDTSSRRILRDISSKIGEYKACSGANEAQMRDNVVKVLNSSIDSLQKSMNNQKYSKETLKLFDSKLKELNFVLRNTEERGDFEKVLSILNRNLKKDSPEQYSKSKSLINDMRRVLKKATGNELKMYDKFAEYSVGSAPTDFLGMMLPIGFAGYAISKGENKEEKTSATLKAGIPIAGGVMTTFIAAAKMLSNIQGLLLGTAVSIGLNILGSKVDEKYKQGVEESLFAQKAIEAYKKAGQS